ncbi:DUF1214 domain-containing protein [Notoacmeibacter sp. MSK16QG-6]|uniref:DUF1214 domain-containing protein n=1 Tax=Notoacmeibacter sp. MSK16QG-6 TaxID=2957982 RepID=UPI00209D2460|nr:DUF1214 domain-containing protein [Notoacmeibacter sp. MSK16QG-6]MCP1198143.1 DUF1214 domain-containing protein [Notoacmeibacter sp. MSK16QG-6]
MLRTILLTALSCILALGLGGGSAWFALDRADALGALNIGKWVAYPEAGTDRADPYTRARIARNAALPLAPAEGLVFSRRSDESDRPLRAGCQYILEGRLPSARFWTLHAAPLSSDASIADEDRRVALHSRALLRQPDGSIRIAIGPTIRPGNWLPVAGNGPFRLILSLYDTPLGSGTSISPLGMPTVTPEESCNA